MYTEEEAKTKWCPMVRIFSGTSNYVAACNKNMLDRDKDKDRCIASNCMMWRWIPTIYAPETKSGYCGLAGKP